jgi:hypothetical protein
VPDVPEVPDGLSDVPLGVVAAAGFSFGSLLVSDATPFVSEFSFFFSEGALGGLAVA